MTDSDSTQSPRLRSEETSPSDDAPATEHDFVRGENNQLEAWQGRLEAREIRSSEREAVARHREEAVALREEVAGLREELVAVRERATRDVERAVGELAQLNGELRESNANLVAATLHAQELAEAAQDARRQQDRFLAMLSHELRNPLEPIRSAVDVIDRVKCDDPLLPWVSEVIARQVTHMARLLNDLLDTSRITRGTVTLQRKPVAISEFVKQAIETCRPLMEQRGQTLTVDLPSEPIYIHGDPLRLSQTVGNLLHNATKYTHEKGEITLTGRIEGDAVALYVRDNGCGISSAVLPTVFDLFTQEKSSLSRSEGGLGIGLAVVKSMATLHGGTVEARSDGAGKGSEFVLRLPRLEHMPVEAAVPREAPGPEAATRGIKVLLVDDDADSNDMLAQVLEMAGHEVTKAADGLTAISRICEEPPDVVVCDIGLPGLDGYAVAERVRAQENGPQPILIALTGYGQANDRVRALAAGFAHHLVKPVDPAVLLKLMAVGQEEIL